MAIWAENGWDQAALKSLLRPGRPPALTGDVVASEAQLCHLFTSTTITRTMIASTVSQAHGPHMMHLQPHDRLHHLNAMAATYSCLGFKRKEAFVLREVLAVVMDMLVTAREDGIRTKNGSVGLGISGMDHFNHGNFAFDARAGGGSSGTVGVRPNVNEAGNESVLRLVRYVCGVYGVDLSRVSMAKVDSEKLDQESGGNDDEAAVVDDEDEMDRFGWPELQLGVVREAVAIAEALPGSGIAYSS